MDAPVGLIALEVVFPPCFVDQAELERHDFELSGAPVDSFRPGKHTQGLGQHAMGFCAEFEDVHSVALTALHRLLQRNEGVAARIGWLGVGTETLLDKSKSVKSVLMERLPRTDVEGVDFKNACYGGTAALLAACDWLRGGAPAGDLAVVVMADLAVYAPGPARATGGAGGLALLVGRGEEVALDLPRDRRVSHMEHTWDFYKPDPSSEYPLVDGAASLRAYYRALDKCYAAMRPAPSLHEVDYLCFHAPYSRLVQKVTGRLLWQDVRRREPAPDDEQLQPLAAFRDVADDESSYSNRALELAALSASAALFEQKVAPGLLLSRQVGNMYTCSLYAGLASLLEARPAEQLTGRRLLLFSFGSGLASSLFEGVFSGNARAVDRLRSSVVQLRERLVRRTKVAPAHFTALLARRQELYLGQADRVPESDAVVRLALLEPDTYFLRSVDEKFRRQYELH